MTSRVKFPQFGKQVSNWPAGSLAGADLRNAAGNLVLPGPLDSFIFRFQRGKEKMSQLCPLLDG